MIPPGFIQDLLSRVDIADVVGRHVELKKAGINHKGLCPFHGEKSPSFIVSPSRQTYHCFGCGAHGNAIGFLMKHTGAGFLEAVQDLAQQVGMQVPEDDRSSKERERAKAQKQHQATLSSVLAKACTHYREQLKKTPRAIDYLKRRGLTGQIAAHFGLGYAPEGWRTLASAFPNYDDPLLSESGMVIVQGDDPAEQKRYDRFRDRIMFPIRNVQGDVIGFGGRVLDKGEPKYLNSPETPIFSKGRELYGLFEARQGLRQRGYALVVEGYMDVVALAQHGFNNAVATLGTACTADHVQKLFRFTESVVFSFDGDAAGRRAAARALEAALPHATDTRSVRFLFLPQEHDPDSYVRELGADAFEHCVAQAVPLSRQLIEQCAAGLDLSSAEGRARLLSQAKPLWSLLPQGLLKRQLLGELAKRAELPDQELLALWQVPATKPPQGGHSFHADDTAAPPDADHDMDAWAHHPLPSDDAPPDAPTHTASSPRKPERKKWLDRKDWKDWKKRDRIDDETYGTPRQAPAQPRDHALRMLMLHSAWWEQLSEQDQRLLHALEGDHGQLVAWLERFLMDHGASPWDQIATHLETEGLMEMAQRVCAGRLQPVEGEEFALPDLQQLLRGMRKTQLKAEAHALASQPAQADTLARLKDLHEQIRRLDEPLQAA